MTSRIAALACMAVLAIAPSAHAGYFDPVVIDTPATLLSINDIAIAPDGTGALVYQVRVGPPTIASSPPSSPAARGARPPGSTPTTVTTSRRRGSRRRTAAVSSWGTAMGTGSSSATA